MADCSQLWSTGIVGVAFVYLQNRILKRQNELVEKQTEIAANQSDLNQILIRRELEGERHDDALNTVRRIQIGTITDDDMVDAEVNRLLKAGYSREELFLMQEKVFADMDVVRPAKTQLDYSFVRMGARKLYPGQN